MEPETNLEDANRRIAKLQAVLVSANNINHRLLDDLNVAKYNNEVLQENLRAAEHRLSLAPTRVEVCDVIREALAQSYGNGWIRKPDNYAAESELTKKIFKMFRGEDNDTNQN